MAPAVATEAKRDVELSIVMPCLDEAETLATCIEKARASMQLQAIRGEIIIADNGSTDGSVEIAYFTYPDFEGQGYATLMAQRLIELAASCAT